MKQKLTYKNELDLSYAEYGDRNGYPLLVQHGLIASIDDFDLFDRLLQNGARLICIARPGYGASSPCILDSLAGWADLVAPLVVKLGLARFDILAMSSGAPYGYSLAARFPQEVRHVYVFSGTPALYDAVVRSQWPYPPAGDQSLDELEALAHDLFFSGLSADDLKKNDVRDSMMNGCFGVAQDLKLRFLDWGFRLSDVKARVVMRHSKEDDSVPFQTAVRTAELLPDCELELLESGPHFSSEALDEFIRDKMVGNLKP